MESREIKFTTIGLSLLVFAISLTQNALVVNYNNEIKTASSLEYLFIGSIAFMGGGLLEEIIWLASPLCLLAIKFMIKDDKRAVLVSLIASALAISFSFWNEILGAESGTMAKIVSFELGYYLWLASILILTIGILIHYKMTLKTTLQA
ncbi:hypothetical protein L0669_03040 [Flavobacterium bizetiae]|uniref:hypothetical protein n=1 Tax=Flavobacterium bizetiae TaxID=2704140 RepID=UPI0021E7ECC0|nr:hypothetical protein [Flavobacterium bizetiae]UTN04881.1 hypothetical protein L0669_03040 [Flavobacterium bizetiae]